MIPRRLFTTFVYDPKRGNPFQERHYATFFHCLESWYRLHPAWDIRVITLGNLYECGSDPWVEVRVKEGNFIAVSHWARLKWMLTLGGVYVDCDVESVKPFDPLLDTDFFCGRQGGDAFVNNAVMGAVPGHPLVQDYLHYTTTLPLNTTDWPNETGPRGITKLLRKDGWRPALNEAQHVKHRGQDVAVLGSRYFYPYHWTERFDPKCVTRETVAIHHWNSSWQPLPSAYGTVAP